MEVDSIKLIRRICFWIGVLCVLCAAVPAVVYGNMNTGILGMAIIGAALLLIWRFWDTIKGIKPLRRILVILIVTGGLYVTVLSAVMLHRAYFSAPPDTGELAVIVLGSKINGDQPSLMLRRRLNKAYDYMQQNDAAICIVTGGQGADEIMPEAWVMRDYLIARGIAPERIFVDDKSKNTEQNLAFAAALMPEGYRAIIATDGFHQLRAQIFAKAAGVDAPYSVSSLTPWGLLPTYWLRELLGLPVAVWLATS